MSKVVIREGGAAGGGAVYGLGMIGAFVYFAQHAHSFWAFILGILQALVWPALLVYRAFDILHF